MNNEKLFGECLAHYAQREPNHFLKLYCEYMPNGGDFDEHPDGNGDCMDAVYAVELMYGAAVQVLIPHDTDPVIAARQLKKLAKWLQREPRLMKVIVTDHMKFERMKFKRKSREEEDQCPY